MLLHARKLRVLLSLFLQVVSFATVHSQFVPYRNFTPLDGLPSTLLYRVYSDQRGFIWVSGSFGLARYDGHTFRTFTIRDSLPDHEVFDIYDDKNGRIWFTTLRGIPGYVKNNKISSYKAIPKLLEEKVISVYPTSNGDIWFGTFAGNLYQTRNDSIIHVFERHNKSRIVGMTEDLNHKLWYLTYESNKIYVIDNDSSKIIYLPGINGRYHYSRKPLLLKNGNIAFYDLGFCEILNTQTGEINMVADEAILGEDMVICIHEDEMENLWIGTNHGIYLLVKGRNGKYHLKRRFLHHVKASCITQDFEGNFWISSLGQGLFMIPYNPAYAITIKSENTSNNITALVKDKDGNIFVGVDDGNILELRGDNLEVVYKETEKYYISRATAQLNHSGQSVWFLKDDGLIILENGKYKRIKDLIFGKAMVEDSQGNVWIGGAHALFKFNSFGQKINEFKLGRINAVACDQHHQIWFSNEKGLHVLNNNNATLKFPASVFGNQWISDILIDTVHNLLWVSTFSNGLFVISNNRITYHFNSQNGLTSDFINDIVQDNQGDLWIATKKGINYIDFENQNFPQLFRIGVDAGLASEEVNRILVSDQYIYVGTSEGLSILEKRNLRIERVPPRIFISNVFIAEKEQEPQENYKISYTQARLKINVVGLAYNNNEPLTYKYIMEGLDSSWSYTNSPSIHYNSMLPGKYVFKVKAINRDGMQSENAAVANFEVSFAYWQTLWFRVFLLFIAMMVLFVSMVVRVRSIKKREEEKTRLTRLLGELELTALKAQMNPHFIFNSLGSIQNLINRDKKMEANIYLSKFARLLRMTLDYSDKREIPLADEINMLEHYLSLESLRFVNKFEYIIDPAPGLDLYEVKIPPMLLQPFIENSIKHGLLPKKGDARLIVSFKRQSDGTLYCMVEDNGIGRVQREKLKEKSQMGHISKGIKITRNRLELLNQIRNKPAEIRITDLYHDSGEAAGTRVEVIIPIE